MAACLFTVAHRFRVEQTKASWDGGVDLHLFQQTGGDDVHVGIVQCKRYTHHAITVGDVERFHMTVVREACNVGYFVCTTGFTRGARTYAEHHPSLRLWDGATVKQMLREHADAVRKVYARCVQRKQATPRKARRKAKHQWTAEEEACLRRGVQKHGNRWSKIAKDEEFALVHALTPLQLKDKARNMQRVERQAERRPL